MEDEESVFVESGEDDGNSVVKEDDMETQDQSEENPDETLRADVKKNLNMKSLVRALGVARKAEIPEEDTVDQSESTVSTLLVDKLPHQHGQTNKKLTKRQKQRLFMDNLFELSRQHIANTPKQNVVPGTRARNTKKVKTGFRKTRKEAMATSVKAHHAISNRTQQTGERLKISPTEFLVEVARCSEIKCGSSENDLFKCGENIVENDATKIPFHCGPRNTDDNVDDADIVQDRGPFRLDRVNGLVKEEIPVQVNAADDEVEITKGKTMSPLDVIKKIVQCGSVPEKEEVDHMDLVRSETEGSPGSRNNIQYRDPTAELRDTMVVIGGPGGLQDKNLEKTAAPKKQIRVVTTEDLQNDFNGEVVDLVHLILDKEKAKKRDDNSTISTRKSLLATG